MNGAGDPDLRLVLDRFVVEKLEVGLPGDRGVNLLLANDAGFPERCDGGARRRGPVLGWLAGNLPYQQAVHGRWVTVRELGDLRGRREVHGLPFPGAAGDGKRSRVSLKRFVQSGKRRFDGWLALVPDRVNLRVVGDGLNSLW